LEKDKITVGRTMVFSLQLAVSTTGYDIDKNFFLSRHVEGEYLFRDTLIINITDNPAGRRVRYLFSDSQWSESRGREAHGSDGSHYHIRIECNNGFAARRVVAIQPG